MVVAFCLCPFLSSSSFFVPPPAELARQGAEAVFSGALSAQQQQSQYPYPSSQQQQQQQSRPMSGSGYTKVSSDPNYASV